MTALVARMRPRWAAVFGAVAGVAGAALRQVGRGVPGLAGPGLIAYGVWSIYHPAGLIVAGGFLLLLDRRMP